MFCEFEQNYFIMNRGDSFEFPIVINSGTDLCFEKYNLTNSDKIYVGIMEPHQSFENALIRKVITCESETDGKGNPLLILTPEDTENVLTGKYFIMIKLAYKDCDINKVKTILPMKEFFIEGTNKHVSDRKFVTHIIDVDGDDAPEWEPI